jgi:hypothetical protein
MNEPLLLNFGVVRNKPRAADLPVGFTISYLAAVNPKTSFGWLADSPQNRGDEVFLVFTLGS